MLVHVNIYGYYGNDGIIWRHITLYTFLLHATIFLFVEIFLLRKLIMDEIRIIGIVIT